MVRISLPLAVLGSKLKPVCARTLTFQRDSSVTRMASISRARRAADWTLASYVGPTHSAHHRQEVRTFGGKDPVDFYLEDVMLHGTAEMVADQIRALADAGMTYLMAAPLSRRSFNLLTDKVLPRIAV
jgi:alkanesulfonate monooxygenase SsuD/methylene tetrahydromethanopterin reductase-like flavin-dependent oxidoreductase (luciferase family)